MEKKTPNKKPTEARKASDKPLHYYCPDCKKAFIGKAKGDACPTCGKVPPESIDQDIRTPLVQSLHREATANADKRDAAMSFLVLGAIFLVIGFIFLQLSYKPVSQTDSTKVIRPGSLEFVVSMLGIVLGGAAFVYGVARAVYHTRKIRVLHHDIDYINSKMRLDPGPTPLLVSDLYKNLSLRFRNYLKIRAVEKANQAAKSKEAERAGEPPIGDSSLHSGE